MLHQTQLIVVGGLSGAGKTAVISSVAQAELFQGKRVGVLLVGDHCCSADAELYRRLGLPVQELAGSHDLQLGEIVAAIESFVGELTFDRLFVELSGPASSLAAAVRNVLAGKGPSGVGPAVCVAVVRPEPGKQVLEGKLISNVEPLDLQSFEQQVQGADLVIATCQDRLLPEQSEQWTQQFLIRFPEKSLLQASARSEEGRTALLASLSRALAEVSADPRHTTAETQSVKDSQVVGVNGRWAVSGEREFLLDDVLLGIMIQLQGKLIHARADVVHLKGVGFADTGIAQVNVVGTCNVDLTTPCGLDMTNAEVVINARARCRLEELQSSVHESIKEISDLLQLTMKPQSEVAFE